MSDILELCNESNLKLIGDEIANCIDSLRQHALLHGKVDDKGKVDFAFNVSAGKIKSSRPNTFIWFDLPRDGKAYAFVCAMYARELNDQEINDVNNFVHKIAEYLMDEHKAILRDAARQFVVPDSEPWVIPIENIRISTIELVDYSSVDEESRHLIKVFKKDNATVNMNALMNELAKLRDESPELTNEEIAEREISKGNPAFKGVEGITRGERYLFDVSLSLFADYSYSDEFIAQMNAPVR